MLEVFKTLLADFDQHGFFVFPSHDEEWKHNKGKLLEINQTYPVVKISAEMHGLHANKSSADKAGGLVRLLYVAKQAKVMLTCNIIVKFGLYNGSVGTVIDVIYPPNKSPQDNSFPKVIMVDFPKYTGPPFMQNFKTLVPIVPVERRLECGCCKRKQIPLRLGWGTTIHQCQGQTIGNGEINRYVVISPGTRAFESRNPGALYVAMSRD